MLGCSHNVRSSLVLAGLHPALTKEFPAKNVYMLIFTVISPTFRTYVCEFAHTYSLIWDGLEDQVVQQCELLGYLQGRVVLKRLSLIVRHGLIHKKTVYKCTTQ